MAGYISSDLSLNDIVAVYYHPGYTVNEIREFLATRHGTMISGRQAFQWAMIMLQLRRAWFCVVIRTFHAY